jgi:hypothetical protein
VSDLPRLALRPNPASPWGYDIYVWDDGNAWTGWLRTSWGGDDMDDPVDLSGVLTRDGERDLIELTPKAGA